MMAGLVGVIGSARVGFLTGSANFVPLGKHGRSFISLDLRGKGNGARIVSLARSLPIFQLVPVAHMRKKVGRVQTIGLELGDVGDFGQ
jgi:hypothetical protein